MTDLGAGVSPRALIPGDPEALGSMGRQLSTLASGLGDAAATLQGIEGGGSWVGKAGDAFRAAVSQQPDRYEAAASGFSVAGSALVAYSSELADAQRQAAAAIAEWESAQSATSAWQQARAEQVALAKHSGSAAPAQGSDPGEAGRGRAQAMLSSAQAQLEAAAARLRAQLEDAKQGAPKKPGFFHRMFHDAEHLASAAFHYGEKGLALAAAPYLEELKIGWHFAEGMGDFAKGTALGLWDLGKYGYALETDPVGTLERTGKTLYAVGDYAVHHPVGFAKAVGGAAANWQELKKDPARWAGEIVPTIAVAVLTGGAAGYAAGLRGSAAVYEGTEVGAQMASDAEKVQAAVDTVHRVQNFSTAGVVLNALDERDREEATRVGPEYVRDGIIEHVEEGKVHEAVTEALRPRVVEPVAVRVRVPVVVEVALP